MAFESSGTILYVTKISYQSVNWFGNCKGVDQHFTRTRTHTNTHARTRTHTRAHTHAQTRRHTRGHTQTHTQTHAGTHVRRHARTHAHTHTEAYFISLVFLQKCRNKTKKAFCLSSGSDDCIHFCVTKILVPGNSGNTNLWLMIEGLICR